MPSFPRVHCHKRASGRGSLAPLLSRARSGGGVSVEYACRIHEGCTRIHRNRDTERLNDFFARGTMSEGRSGMNRYAAVALTGDRDGERDEFTRLRAKQIFLISGVAEFPIPSSSARTRSGEFSDGRLHLLTVSIPIEHHRTTPCAICAEHIIRESAGLLAQLPANPSAKRYS